MRKMTFWMVGLLACLLAAGPMPSSAQTGEGRLISLRMGAGTVVGLPTRVERVVLGDESIVSLHVASEFEVVLNALSPGLTTLDVWLEDGRRLKYRVQVEIDTEFLSDILGRIDPRIVVDVAPNGRSVVLSGEVSDAKVAEMAKSQAELLLQGSSGAGPKVLSLLRYPGGQWAAEARLTAALKAIDSRIEVRRIQVGEEPDPARDSYVLEGRVRSLDHLVRAITIAERQLGGTGTRVVAVDEGDRNRLYQQRNRFMAAPFFGGSGGAGSGGGGALAGTDVTVPGGLASQVARRLVVTSDSGKVVSFLEVDELPQVMVAIRVLEIDRTKARRMGINIRVDHDRFSIQQNLGPQSGRLPGFELGGRGDVTLIEAGANLVGAFVDQVTSIATAVDFLEGKALARSVAEPNLVTLSGEAATVLVGGEIPIPTTAVGQVATVQGVFFQDFGVRLDVRPTATGDGSVTLEVAPSIIRPNAGLGIGEVPGFVVQTVQTIAKVGVDQSLVIGGLLSFQEGLDERGLPGLQRIPLFRWQKRTREEREVMFILTPRLVGNATKSLRPDPSVPNLDWPEGQRLWKEIVVPKRVDRDGVPPALEETVKEPEYPPPGSLSVPAENPRPEESSTTQPAESSTPEPNPVPPEAAPAAEAPPATENTSTEETPLPTRDPLQGDAASKVAVIAPEETSPRDDAAGEEFATSSSPSQLERTPTEAASAASVAASVPAEPPASDPSAAPVDTAPALSATPDSAAALPAQVVSELPDVAPDASSSPDVETSSPPAVAVTADASSLASPASRPVAFSRPSSSWLYPDPPSLRVLWIAEGSYRCLRLRMAPSRDSQPLGCYSPGQMVEFLEEHKGWIKVRMPRSGEEGWMLASHLDPLPPTANPF